MTSTPLEHVATPADLASTVGAMRSRPRVTRSLVEDVVVLGALAIALIYLTSVAGGRGDTHMIVTGAVLTVAAVTVRFWRIPRLQLLLALWVIGAGIAIAFLHGSLHGDGMYVQVFRWPSAGGYALGGLTFLTVRAYADSGARRRLLVSLVCLAGAVEFTEAVTRWGHGQRAVTMIGTFTWYNQYAAFLMAPALLGLGLVIRWRAPWRLAGAIAAVMAWPGVVFSTSRACMAVLGVAWVAVGIIGVIGSTRRRAAVGRWLAVSVLAAFLTVGLSGPPLFAHSTNPLQATDNRSAAQPVSGNTVYRTEFWREAFTDFTYHPLDGTGYGNLAVSATHSPAAWARSTQAHDGVLQAFADGGLVLGLPVLAAVIGFGAAGLRRVWAGLRRRQTATAVSAVALLALLAHSLADFDWSYPSLTVMFAVVGAVVVTAPTGAVRRQVTVPRQPDGRLDEHSATVSVSPAPQRTGVTPV